MALPKKNALNQILFLMVDGTDFATIESALTAMPTGKFYGVNHGGSAAVTSGALSKTISHVRSGLYRATIKATEANYDHVDYRFIHASAADQHVQVYYADNDDSDIMSAIALLASVASDAASAAQQANSRVLLNLSRISDIASFLVVMSGMLSDVDSALTSQYTAGHPLTASDMSDLRSAILLGAPLYASDLSDLRSAIAGVVAALSPSDISDIASAVWAHTVGTRVDSRVLLNQSRISDLASAVSDLNSDLRSLITTTGVQLNASSFSDLRSAIAGVTATLTASDLSDIASAVWANTVGTRVDSRVLVVQSLLSDVDSALTSQFTAGQTLNASTMSDLRSAIAGVTVTLGASDVSDIASAVLAGLTGLTASDISDIASAVEAILASRMSDIYSATQQTNSRALAIQSMVSDIESTLTSQFTAGHPLTASDLSDLRSAILVGAPLYPSDLSDLRSAITAAQALTASDISDLRSAITAGVTVSNISDIASAVWAHALGVRVDSRVLLLQSLTSDIDSALTSQFTAGQTLNASTMSDLRSAIAGVAATLSASDISDIASAVWANTIGARVDSRVLLTQSRISDAQSMLSDLYSDFQSRVPKRVATDSQLSDLHSDLRSYLGVMSGILSDVYSGMSDLGSDLRSLVTTTGVQLNASSLSDLRSAITAAAVTLDASTLSDIASQVWAHAIGARVDSRLLLTQSRVSDLQSYLVGMSGMLSDVHSAATQTNSRVLAVQSQTSDIYSLLSDVGSDLTLMSGVLSGFESDFQSRFPATIPELTGDPGATPTWAQAEALVFGWLKHDTTGTPTKRLLKNAAGTTVLSGLVNWNGTTSVFNQGALG